MVLFACPKRSSEKHSKLAEEAVRSYGENIASAIPGLRNSVIKQPVGMFTASPMQLKQNTYRLVRCLVSLLRESPI